MSTASELESNVREFADASASVHSYDDQAKSNFDRISSEYVKLTLSNQFSTSNVAHVPFVIPFPIQSNVLLNGPIFSDEFALEKIFTRLAKTWKKETGHFSLISKRYQHPAYKSILEMKDDAIPLILNELRRDPDRWFSALQELTGQNAAEGAQNFYEAVDRWVAWGTSHGYIK